MTQGTSWPGILGALVRGEDLSISESTWAMSQVMSGEATPAQIGALLLGLRIKGETVDELVGFRDAALAAAAPLAIPSDALDIVGTGGDAFGGILNISSVAAVIAAATGVPVVKHGNRAASSKSGASDVLTELGVKVDLSPEQMSEVFHRVGITYANAAVLHQGFRHAGPPRREIGIPTLFNVLGPLCNPARPNANAVGVADLDRVPLMTGVLQTRGASALVYRGDGGIDKLTTTGHSHVWEISNGSVTEHDIDPVEFGIGRARVEEILGGDPAYNADVIRSVLSGERSAQRDVVLLNAAAGIVAYELHKNPETRETPLRERLSSRIEVAAEAVDSGAAKRKLEEWAAATSSWASA